MSTAIEERSILTLGRTFAARREHVFAAWTEPEQIKQWFGPDTCKVLEAYVDLRVGGSITFAPRARRWASSACAENTAK
jgi:uncharacterized protein YndB with AHSA1/START domain